MKIMQIPAYAVIGGMPLHVLALSRGLKDRGHDVEVLSMCDGPLLDEFHRAGVKAEAVPFLEQRLRRDPLLTARAVRHVRGAIRRFRPDIVHTHGPRAHLIAGMASRLAGRPVLVATAHGSFRQFTAGQEAEMRTLAALAKKLQYGSIDRLTGALADRVVAVSEATREDLVSNLRLPRDKVSVIYNGIEESAFPEAAREEIRRQTGFSDSDRVVACVGRIAYHKGSADLIAAMERVAEVVREARFVIVGSGPMEESLRRRAGEGSLRDSAVFTGQLEEARPLLAAADLVVLPSLSEGLPLVLLEAAMLGRPVVATNVGGIAEIVTQGETGLLVSPHDPAALADAMVQLLKSDARRLKMGEAARKQWEERFQVGQMLDGMESLYTELLATRPQSGQRRR